ncbi:type IV secretion protein Rhs, partial [Bacteroidales bacterium OttesenSCG-928-I14]|nr:type IV secretion protein Rhs [Bacteroidales bacterium OttesenSCG-928-I14]
MKTHNTKTTIGILVFIAIFSVIVVFSRTSGSEDKVFNDTPQEIIINSPVQVEPVKATPPLQETNEPQAVIKTEKEKPKPKKVSVIHTEYLSMQGQGIIGLYKSNLLDDPSDNIFTVKLDKGLSHKDIVYLNFDLTGVNDYTNIPYIINDRLAVGGYLVKHTETTSRQKLRINPGWLKKGENYIQFGLPENATFGYVVANLSIEVVKNEKPSVFVVNTSDVSYDGKAYLHGFVQSTHTEGTHFYINEEKIESQRGEFETLLSLSGNETISLRAVLPNGKEYKKTLTYNDNLIADNKYELNSLMEETSKLLKQGTPDILSLGSTSIEVDSSSLISPEKEIFLTSLRHIDVPAMDMGMSNTTAEYSGYRFLPHGEHFSDEGARVAIKYDRTKIPSGYTEDDIRTYYFDLETRHWAALELDSIDRENQMIISRTTHFTDMINGVIQVPESPETQGYAPTMMTDIKAADPSSKIQLISPPNANNRGSANLNYSFEMPPSRNGMSPNLAISYNSDGGSGWLGEGWDMNISSIKVDTRWGVPRYTSDYETETYLMDGNMLMTTNGRGNVTVSHREDTVLRIANRQFYLRQEGGFSQIIRKNSTTNSYYWEVIDKSGTKYTYGTNNGILRDPKTNNIAEWRLSKIVEVHGDSIEYHYREVDEPVVTGLTAKALYLDSVKVGIVGRAEPYTIVTFSSSTQKAKKVNNARYGFLTSSNRLLDSINISFENELLRRYTFTYEEGAFKTERLKSVTHKDSFGNDFASHDFDYYDDVASANGYDMFESRAEIWNLHEDNLDAGFVSPNIEFNGHGFSDKASALGGNKTSSYGVSLYSGVGAGYDPITISGTLGGSYSYNRGETSGISTLVDINGDGLPDKVFIKEKGIGFLKKDVLYYRPNISQSTDDYYKFGEEIEIVGIDKFSKTTSNTHTGGWNVSVGILIATAILGDDWSKSTAETSVYFSDVNNDGLIDIVSDKKVYFNHIEYDAQGRPVPTFTLQSSDTPNPILGGGPKRTEGAAVDSLEQNKIIKNSPMQDAVRFWEAPFDGKVEITGTFRQLPPPDTYVYERDGLCFSVQLEDSILFESAIYPNNLDIDSIDISEYYFVNKGDRIFFRVQSGWNKYANGYFDKVELNPVITYVGETNDIAPNGLSSTVYKSTESNVYTDNRYALMPAATPISVVGTFRKGITSDNLDLKINFMEAYIEVSGDNDTIYKYNPREIYSRHFAWNETFDGRLDIPSDLMANFYSPVENMTAGNNFQFLVHSDSNIAFDSVDWNPAIMQSYQVYDSIMMSYVNRDANIAAPVAYSVYASHNYKGIPFYSSILGDPTLNVQFSPMLKHYDEPTNFPLQHRHSQLVNGKFWILIKNQNGLVHKREINIVNNNIALNSDFVIPLPDAGTYWVEYYVTDEKILALIDKPDVGIITYRGSSPFQWISQKCYYAANVYSPRQENSFGPMYRGWGQFVYNAAGNRYALPIDTALLNKNNYLNEGDTINPLTVGFFPMTVVREDSTNLRYWKGADDNNYIKGNCFSASRLGMQDVIVTNPLEEAKKLSLKATDNSQAFRPNLKTESSSHVKLNSFGVLGISKSDSKGESKTKTAMMDINGDGYPDIIDQTGIQFTDIYGSLNGDFVRFREDTVFFISDNTSHGIAYSLSGEAVHSQVTSIRNIGKKSESRSSSEAKIALEIGVSSMAIPLPSGSYSTGGDEATNAWVDVNGDGLPDKIFNSKKVQLNLGYGFSDSIEWSIDTIQIGKNLSVNAGLGLSFGSSLSVGTGVAKTTSETNYILMDVNADGLPDKVMKRDRNIYVSLNMGNTFAAPEIWRRVNEISSSSSTSESFNGSFAVNVTFSFIKWSTRLGGGKATAMSRDNFALRDVDGDGYLEIVESHNDGTMSVYRSKIGRTNMLKTVKNPLGGSFTLDYERSRATYDHPGGKWTMSSVELNDGIFDDGPSVKNLFIYGNGKHDRREREFLGFEKVITQNINTESEDNEVYRELEKTYDVISVYTAGNEKASVVRDGQGNKYMETRNDYYLYRVSPSADNYQFNNHTSTSEPIIAYSPLKYTKTTVYEGETQGMTANEIFYNYHLNNHYGDLKTYTYSDKGNLGASGTGDYNYRTSIEYTHN